MTVLWCGVGGLVGGALLWLALRPALQDERFLKTNFRGSTITGVGGVPLAIVGAIGSMILLLTAPVDGAPGDGVALEAAFGGFQLAVGFGVLGFLDDVGAGSSGGGFRGHLTALRSGRVTTGLVKLAGGVPLSLLVAAIVSDGDTIGVLRDAALIAGGANLANLFDRAPGRSVKVALICGIAMAAAVGIEPELAFAALVLGAAIGVAYWELGEKLMLGDTGVNVLGAMVALSAVTTLGSGPRWVVLAVVVALNLLSEFVSFSRVIDAVTPLRWFDRLGRPSP